MPLMRLSPVAWFGSLVAGATGAGVALIVLGGGHPAAPQQPTYVYNRDAQTGSVAVVTSAAPTTTAPATRKAAPASTVVVKQPAVQQQGAVVTDPSTSDSSTVVASPSPEPTQLRRGGEPTTVTSYPEGSYPTVTVDPITPAPVSSSPQEQH